MAKIILLCLMLAGCAAAPVVTQPPPVIAQCPKPPVVNRPDLPVDHLTADSTPDEVVLAAKVSIKMLQKWGLLMEEILNGYRGN